MFIASKKKALVRPVPAMAMVLIMLWTGQLFAQSKPRTHVGMPIDWSSQHVIHSKKVDASLTKGATADPRALFSYYRRNWARMKSAAQAKKASIATDWRFTLGAGTVAPGMYPAKYGFFVTASPDCANDFAVFGLNTSGTLTQPNLVAFNNLYIGPGNVGACSATTTGGLPTVKWAYNVSTANGPILTSPTISIGGDKVAFIESPAGQAIFHVLTVGTTPVVNGSFDSLLNQYVPAVPGVGNDASMLSVTYSTSATNTLSSPFIDYNGDVAYFGDDNGNIYKTNCVFFCEAHGLTLAVSPLVQVSPGIQLTAPTVDIDANRLLVGGSNGVLYSVLLTDCPATCPVTSLAVGAATAHGAIITPPIVDTTFQTVFVTSGQNSTGTAVAVEATETLGTVLATLPMSTHAYTIPNGAFNDLYYNNAIGDPAPVGNMYFCGPATGSGQAGIFTQSFTSTGTLSIANPPVMAVVTSVNIPGNKLATCSPLMEFSDGTTDRLFFSQTSVPNCNGINKSDDGCVFTYTLAGATITAGAQAIEHGTSGMIIDNASTAPQAASIYFANSATTGTYDPATNSPKCTYGLTNTPAYCAVKRTQSALQ